MTTHPISNLLQQALAELEKFSGPEVEAMKASGKSFLDDTVKAAGPLSAQIFNIGLEAVPGLKLFAAPIEAVADPIVSGFVGHEAQRAETALEGNRSLPQSQPE